MEVIVLRLMSKGFRKFDSHIDEFDGGCKLKVHTKLSSQVGTGVDLLKGTETRVPLDKTLYMEVIVFYLPFQKLHCSHFCYFAAQEVGSKQFIFIFDIALMIVNK